MSISNQVEVLEQDLIESETNYKILEREMSDLEDELANLRNDLSWYGKFEIWLSKVYPNAHKEYQAIIDIEKGV